MPTPHAGRRCRAEAPQLLGGAGGPLLAAVLIGDHDVRGVLWMGGALMLTGFAMVAWLFFTTAGGNRFLSLSA